MQCKSSEYGINLGGLVTNSRGNTVYSVHLLIFLHEFSNEVLFIYMKSTPMWCFRQALMRIGGPCVAKNK